MVKPDDSWQEDYDTLKIHYLQCRVQAKTLPGGNEMTLRRQKQLSIMETHPYRTLLKTVAKLDNKEKHGDLYRLFCKLRAYDMGFGNFPSEAVVTKQLEVADFVDLTQFEDPNNDEDVIDVDKIDLNVLLAKASNNPMVLVNSEDDDDKTRRSIHASVANPPNIPDTVSSSSERSRTAANQSIKSEPSNSNGNGKRRAVENEEDAASAADVKKAKLVDYEKLGEEVSAILTQYAIPKPWWSRSVSVDKQFELPKCYDNEEEEENHIVQYKKQSEDPVSMAFFDFLYQVGWVATHLMYAPYTEYRVITEATIRCALETVMHPKHWHRSSLYTIISGWPKPYKPPETDAGEPMYEPMNLKKQTDKVEYKEAKEKEKAERKRFLESGEKDPDGAIRAAADSGAYLCSLGMRIGCFTGEIAANREGFDEEKDKERIPLHSFCRTMCNDGSRAVYEKLTSDDKAKIDSILGPGYSDVMNLLNISELTSTGVEKFDKICPLPPPEYRLDASEMLGDIIEGLMFERVVWASSEPVFTPRAAALLTAALSAVLYKAHMHRLEANKKRALEENSEEDSNH